MGVTMFFENKEFNPFIRRARLGNGSRRRRRRTISITRVSASSVDHALHVATPMAGRSVTAQSAWQPALGAAWKKATAKMVSPRRQHCGVRIQLRQSLQLSRPRPDLQGPARTAAAAAHLQFRGRNDYKVMEYTLGVREQDRTRDESHHHGSRRACGAGITTSFPTNPPTIPGTIMGNDPKGSVVNRYL